VRIGDAFRGRRIRLLTDVGPRLKVSASHAGSGVFSALEGLAGALVRPGDGGGGQWAADPCVAALHVRFLPYLTL
jgi:hypothetical protein